MSKQSERPVPSDSGYYDPPTPKEVRDHHKAYNSEGISLWSMAITTGYARIVQVFDGQLSFLPNENTRWRPLDSLLTPVARRGEMPAFYTHLVEEMHRISIADQRVAHGSVDPAKRANAAFALARADLLREGLAIDPVVDTDGEEEIAKKMAALLVRLAGNVLAARAGQPEAPDSAADAFAKGDRK
jgi:hypothetical protein